LISSALLIVNPGARSAAGREGDAVAAFAADGVACEVVRTTRAGHAAELAVAADPAVEAVFTLGGDGTAMEAVGALAGSGRPVGILPGGTGNLIARTLGTPLGVKAAVGALLRGEQADVDLGAITMDGLPVRRFAFAAGIGIDARMIEETPANLKRRIGVLAYAFTAARAVLSGERFHVEAEVDGEVIRREASAVMVVNFGAVLNDLIRLGPGIEQDDGLLDLCVFAPRTLPEAVRVLWRLARKDFRDDPCVVYRAGRRFRIATTPPRAAQADGELLGRTPLEIRVEPRAARLLLPCREPSPPAVPPRIAARG
jgi:YegS/Rv2252/BmrU family lipid kinase